jgi:hypothetical protein
MMTFSLKATCFFPSALSETYKTAPLNENVKKKKLKLKFFSYSCKSSQRRVLIRRVTVAFPEVPSILAVEDF